MRQQKRAGIRAGFTLVELLFVLSLMIIIITASIPAVDSFLRGKGPESGARMVKSCLFACKMKAIRERREMWFDVRPAGSVGQYVVQGNAGGSVSLNDREGKAASFSPGAFKDMFLRLSHYAGNGRSAQIDTNTASAVRLKNSPIAGAFTNGVGVDIVDKQNVTQFCVSPDVKSEEWEMLPQWVEVAAHYPNKLTENALPIKFRPDGTVNMAQAVVIVKVFDTRERQVSDGGDEIGMARTINVRRNTGSILEGKLAQP
jgi:competence protein ComGC